MQQPGDSCRPSQPSSPPTPSASPAPAQPSPAQPSQAAQPSPPAQPRYCRCLFSAWLGAPAKIPGIPVFLKPGLGMLRVYSRWDPTVQTVSRLLDKFGRLYSQSKRIAYVGTIWGSKTPKQMCFLVFTTSQHASEHSHRPPHQPRTPSPQRPLSPPVSLLPSGFPNRLQVADAVRNFG